MRLLHTSDWHLGRTVKQRWSRDADFDAVLAEITGIARDARPDLIIHSGDLFDSFRPAAADLPGACMRSATCPTSHRSSWWRAITTRPCCWRPWSSP